MKKCLFVLAHPHIRKSRANRAVLEEVKKLDVTINDLYEKYPTFHIDVEREQELLLQHDLIVLQHPFYWYSMPALLKQWLDDVFLIGFAYGSGGDKLSGKDFLLSFTAGGPREAYKSGGYNNYEIQSFFPPYHQTALLCQMNWIEPCVLFSSIKSDEAVLSAHAKSVSDKIREICNG